MRSFVNRPETRTNVSKWCAPIFAVILSGFGGCGGDSGGVRTTATTLEIENINSSVWPDNSVSVAMSVRNASDAALSDVRIASLEVSNGTALDTPPLPIVIGGLPAKERYVVNGRYSVPIVDGREYKVVVRGTYSVSQTTADFALDVAIHPRVALAQTLGVTAHRAEVKSVGTSVFPPVRPVDSDRHPNDLETLENLIPIGPERQLLPPTPAETAIQPASMSALGKERPAALGATVKTNYKHAPDVGWPPDPTAAAGPNGKVVLSAYNVGMSYSIDGGVTFTDVQIKMPQPGRPERVSLFPEDDGGLCCDTVLVFVPARNIFVWLLQYSPSTATDPADSSKTIITAANRLRIAWATADAIESIESESDFWNAWRWLDLTAAELGASVPTGWVDYPDLAFSDNFLYVAVNSVSPGTIGGRRLLARIGLTSLLSLGARTIDFETVDFLGDPDLSGLAFSHLAQQSVDRLVVGALQDSSTMRVLTWVDSEAKPSLSDPIPMSSLPIKGGAFSCGTPGGSDWCRTALNGTISSAVRRSSFPTGSDEFLFAFNGPGNVNQNRAQPYVRIETMRPRGANSYGVAAELDVWNRNFAFVMGTLGVQGLDVGLGISVGSGTIGFPQYGVGYLGDFAVAIVTASAATQWDRYGDYFTVRPIPGTLDFATEAYEVRPTSVLIGTCTPAICGISTARYVRFGRP